MAAVFSECVTTRHARENILLVRRRESLFSPLWGAGLWKKKTRRPLRRRNMSMASRAMQVCSTRSFWNAMVSTKLSIIISALKLAWSNAPACMRQGLLSASITSNHGLSSCFRRGK